VTAGQGLPPFFQLTVLGTVDSTNEEAKRRAAAGAPEGTLIRAERQSAGRGRRGRPWTSPEGNLYCSLILRPTVPAMEAAQLSFVTSLALAEALEQALPPGTAVKCKWPNDVLVEGRKIAGILLESQARAEGLEWMVVGMGVNVASHPGEGDVETPATSLKAMGSAWEAENFLSSLLGSFLPWYRRWRDEGFTGVRQAWLERAMGLGGPIRVRLTTETLFGTFAGLDSDGTLLLDQDGGQRRKVAAGDVFFG
jgi:BirA family biotin operon repressor/biotin-[acetyl-CoA-carboxylase] ligase